MRQRGLLAGIVALALVGCAPTFTESTEPVTVEIPVQPNATPYYAEERVAIPEEAQNDVVEYEGVVVSYEITSEGLLTSDAFFDPDVEIWVSDDEETDGTWDAEADERLFSVTVAEGEKVTGSAESEELRRALNAGNDYFVVGGWAESITGGGTVTITFTAEVSGRLDPF